MAGHRPQRPTAIEWAGSPPDVVARAVLHALTTANPQPRYVVGKHARLLTTLARVMPDRELDAVRSRIFSLPKAVGLTRDLDHIGVDGPAGRVIARGMRADDPWPLPADEAEAVRAGIGEGAVPHVQRVASMESH